MMNQLERHTLGILENKKTYIYENKSIQNQIKLVCQFSNNNNQTNQINISYYLFTLMRNQELEKRPGIRLKQLEILKSRENASYRDDPQFFLQPIIEYATKPVNKQPERNREKSRRRIFENRDKSPQHSQVKNSKFDSNTIQKYEQQISRLKQQLQDKEIKLRGIQNKTNELIFHHETEIKKKQSEISKLYNKLKEYTQQIEIKDNQIRTLKLQLQRNSRFNHLVNENQRLSSLSNFNKKQNFNIFDDMDDNRNKIYSRQNQTNSRHREMTQYIPAARKTTDLGLFLTNSNSYRQKNKYEDQKRNEFNEKPLQFEKANSNISGSKILQQTKKQPSYKNQQKVLQFYDFQNQLNSFSKNPQIQNRKPGMMGKPFPEEQQESQIEQYLSPLDIDIGKSNKQNKKAKQKSGFIQNSKEFHFEDLRNIQEFEEYLTQ